MRLAGSATSAVRKPQMEKRVPIMKHEDQHCACLSIALPSLTLTQSYPRRLLELELDTVTILSLSIGKGEDGWGGVLCGRSRVCKLWPF